jgi:3-deoxy-manno-octulosonate cytidylyltransferase (CMP-KDO synthetase)
VQALEADAEAPMATVVHPLESDALGDPNRVKVVLDRRGRALYFSRAPIPYQRADAPAPRWLQHVGLYAYRRPFLERFLALAPGEAERAEGLEQLRALEHGFAIRCAVIEGWRSVPVDVPADVARVEAVLAGRGR